MGIAAVTWLLLKECLRNKLTNWDDINYLLLNPLIQDMSWDGIKAIFSTPVMGNYHPITILSYALEYSHVSYEAWLFHFDNLVLHVANTMLVYWLVMLLTKRQVAAAITALLFGLHPMHVESVAWVADRKDLLCALGYLGACITYIYYLRTTSVRWILYPLSICLFLFALLSKPIAVALAPTLLLIDYAKDRLDKKVFVEKIPFFALSLAFGILSVRDQASIDAVNNGAVHFSILSRPALGAYAFFTYLWKVIIPVHLCCFYPYPENINGSVPPVFYLFAIALAVLLWAVWTFGRKNKAVIFGFLFFMINISLLLQFIPVGSAIIAERYTYIPYIGLFYIAGWFVSEYVAGYSNVFKSPVMIISLACICVLGYVSNTRCKVWYDSLSLWTDAFRKEPNAPIVYANLGSLYYSIWDNKTDLEEKKIAFDSAFYLLKRFVELCPDSTIEDQALGMLYYKKKNMDSANIYFKKYAQSKSTAQGYSDYGDFLVMMGRDDSAIAQYSIAIDRNPNLFAAILNRGALYIKHKNWQEAMTDINTAILLKPRSGEAFYQRSFCDTAMISKAMALNDVEKAISLRYSGVDSNYYKLLRGL